ncbi:MAG: glycosyltransferase family 2 protein [Planctomycetota bacterium]|jgi:hypothetical protein
MAAPRVSVVIPSWAGVPEALLASIARQTLQPCEPPIVIEGVKPSGKARNLGAARARGELILFVDDDAVLGDEHVIERLAAPFGRPGAQNLGVTGTAKILPPDASWFQRRVAYEIPRMTHAVVTEDVESNPSTDGYGFTEITTTCAMVHARAFDAVGGFHEDLHRGVDTEFFFQVRKRDFRFWLIADTWVYHPVPGSLRDLLAKFHEMGTWHAQEAMLDPSRRIGPQLNFVTAPLYFLLRTCILVPNMFIPRSRAYRRWELAFKPLKALASYVNSFGYSWSSVFRRTPQRRPEGAPKAGSAAAPADTAVSDAPQGGDAAGPAT